MKKKVFIKKLIIATLLITLITSIGVVYLNEAILPTKIKNLLIQELKKRTGKQVELESLHFNLFRGLVIKNLKISDGKKELVYLPQTSCSFLFWPFFKKRLIIPHIRFISPVVFLERRPDNTFNLQDLLRPAAGGKPAFSFSIYGASVSGGRIDFEDDTLQPQLLKSINNINLALSLALPAQARFRLKCEIPGETILKIDSQGEYFFSKEQAFLQAKLQGLSPKEFLGYFQDFGIEVGGGNIDALLKVSLKNKLVTLDAEARAQGLEVYRQKLSLKLTSGLKAVATYNLTNRKEEFSGNLNLENAEVSGVEFAGQLKNMQGQVKFNSGGFSSDNLRLEVWGFPVVAKVKLSDFQNPKLTLEANSALTLDALSNVLKDKFALALPASLNGGAKLFFSLDTKLPRDASPSVNGYLDIIGGSAVMIKPEMNLKKINGRLEFNGHQLKWSGLKFEYLDLPYQTSGVITDFKSPGVQFKLSSQDLDVESVFAVANKSVNLTKCAGRYLNSRFSLTGDIDLKQADNPQAVLEGQLKWDLSDSGKIFNKFKPQLEQAKLTGVLAVQVGLGGKINDFRSCTIKANFSGPEVSFYGLRAQNLSFNYNQSDGTTDISQLQLSLYDGLLSGAAQMKLAAESFPFTLDLSLVGLNLEKLKRDTPAKQQDISGILQAQAKINGFASDLGHLNGSGRIAITGGKLWQLDLFKGIGALLFSSDFTNIVFSEGNCTFLIQDKSVLTNDLKLTSNLADLSGALKIGFDGSLDGQLDVHVSETAPLSGTFKDVTTAFIGQAGRFGVIKLSGTLKEPKYKFKTAVIDIIKGLKDIFLQ